jgi:hypothetical protein
VSDLKGIVTLSIFAALGTAIILNAGTVSSLVSSLGSQWVSLLQTVSGQSSPKGR